MSWVNLLAAQLQAEENGTILPDGTTSSNPPTRICIICQESITGAEIQVVCGHHLDQSCLTNLFEASTRDESLFPPSCCHRDISLTSVESHLPIELIAVFLDKEVEFTTPRRVYCAKATCSRFLGPRDEKLNRRSLPCLTSDCDTHTCSACNSVFMPGSKHSCQKGSRIDRDVITLSRGRGWVRCPGCDEMVEKSFGCMHMVCRCSTQFCYVCRARWKTCGCTRWHERFAVVRRQPVQAFHAVRMLFRSNPSPSS